LVLGNDRRTAARVRIVARKPGYMTLVLWNQHYPKGATEHTRRRWAAHDGNTIPLEPFKGSRLAWYGQLLKARLGYAGGGPNAVILQPQNPYVNRLRRVLAEVRKLPRYRISERTVSLDDYFDRIEEEIKLFEGKVR